MVDVPGELDIDVDAPPAAIDWWALSDVERGLLLVEELSPFVEKFAMLYGLRAVPPCWYQHELLVHEFLALMQYREHMFSVLAPASAPFDFHTSVWVYFLPRIQAHIQQTGCTAGVHDPAESGPGWVIGPKHDVYVSQLMHWASDMDGLEVRP